MDFTYKAYENLISIAKENAYVFCKYGEETGKSKTIILRHDIDFSIDKAYEMALYENRIGIVSTYFVLLTTGFYNVFLAENYKKVKEIMQMGHQIGLHFDEQNYQNDIGNPEAIEGHIQREMRILKELFELDELLFSYHRPSKRILNANLSIDGMINSYNDTYFKQYKYLSDSRKHWREPVLDIIKNGMYSNIHILTHPFWYNREEISMKESLKMFLNCAVEERYSFLESNFSSLHEVIDKPDTVN